MALWLLDGVFEKIISKNPDEEAAAPPPPPVRGASASSPSPEPAFTTVSHSSHRNVLLPDVEIKGVVRFEDDLIVQGKIEGEIHSDGVLSIGETAKIKAEIKCGAVVVNGKVHGNITATESIDLQPNAEVIGDIKAQILTMAAGAVFVGSSTVGAPAEAAPAAKAKAPEPEKKEAPKNDAPQKSSPPKAPQATNGTAKPASASS